jgi:hypothetical protein
MAFTVLLAGHAARDREELCDYEARHDLQTILRRRLLEGLPGIDIGPPGDSV